MMKDCHDAALRYLEHRERSSYEIKTHLISKGYSEEETDAELQELEALHYIDDQRYCENYLRYGTGKGRGPVRIRHELLEKGIDSVLIQESLESHFDRSTEKASAIAEAKKVLRSSGTQQTPDEKSLAKIGRKLASLGYHTDVIYEVIGQLRRTEAREDNN